jgi:hypothetical protein
MFKLLSYAEGSTKEENAEKMKAMLEELPGKLHIIKSLEVGINFYKSERAYDVVLTVQFESNDDLETYRTHPEHLKVADFIVKIRDTAWLVDYETYD